MVTVPARPLGSVAPAPVSPFGAVLDHAFLLEVGWDPGAQVLAPPAGNPSLPWLPCRKGGCESTSVDDHGLCFACFGKRPADPAELDGWLELKREWVDQRGVERDCEVRGCERPRGRANGLCNAHAERFAKRPHQGIAAFLADPATTGYPGFGECGAACCTRRAVGAKLRLCAPHQNRFGTARRGNPDIALDAWAKSAPPVQTSTTATLRGLPEVVRVEFLFALQQRARTGVKTPLHIARKILTILRDSAAASLLDIAVPQTRRNAGYHRTVLAEMQGCLIAATSTPADELKKDTWNLRILGYGGTIDFRPISQLWLRAAAKHWAEEELPRRRGPAVGQMVRTLINHFILLSRSLQLHRDDHGTDLRLLGRRDVLQLTSWMGRLAETGEISQRTRWLKLAQIRRVLRDCRDYGLTRAGQPMHGLPDDYALRRADVPAPPEDDDIGRALPDAVMTTLLQRLPDLETASRNRSVRAATELIMRTGRRPDEICALPLEGILQTRPGRR